MIRNLVSLITCTSYVLEKCRNYMYVALDHVRYSVVDTVPEMGVKFIPHQYVPNISSVEFSKIVNTYVVVEYVIPTHISTTYSRYMY
jgi:hypothetical protein